MLLAILEGFLSEGQFQGHRGRGALGGRGAGAGLGVAGGEELCAQGWRCRAWFRTRGGLPAAARLPSRAAGPRAATVGSPGACQLPAPLGPQRRAPAMTGALFKANFWVSRRPSGTCPAAVCPLCPAPSPPRARESPGSGPPAPEPQRGGAPSSWPRIPRPRRGAARQGRAAGAPEAAPGADLGGPG